MITLLDRNTSRASSSAPDVQRQNSLRTKLQGFPWRVFLITALLPLSLGPIIILSAIAEMASQNYIRGRACYPNGLWKEAAGATWRIMDSTYFFTPNLSFGNMTFTHVKVIDVAWDLLVGRGGQMGLAWVNWVVFNEWLVFHLERWGTSYKMYSTVALQTTSWTMMGVMAKEFLCFGERSWARFFRWLAMASMLISTLYVLAFPTLMAAMTGYITTYEPYVEDYNRDLKEWSKVDEIVRTVQDGVVAKYATENNTYTYTNSGTQPIELVGDDGSGIRAKIVTISSGANWEFENAIWTTNDTVVIEVPLSTGRPLSDINAPHEQNYSIGGRYGDLYNSSWIRSHSSCKPSETYQWGFSYIFLFMVSIFNFLWSFIMIAMWLDTRRGSRMYRSGRRPGFLRSVLDLAAAVREELGPEAEVLEEDEMRRRLTASGGTVCVPRGELRVKRVGTEDADGLRKRERTWTRQLTRGSTF
ncbi:uncharacterized protein M421DRAFT_64569 [Didymella exigua CBS 183.55]|uniref:Uncharacterized protein n=1 Tax=Didymella exigua CBS 183.55 TaxID=1150837 RepID=A0A6A5RHD4_9PLEO|nr:uncharacterized protein M421DRAFT_64569 [Didymella exigua CBS 183.55]KAF1927751.1 hypothetical protein M421DRAFT_64569 [Didymella exigua CBS 183.55]